MARFELATSGLEVLRAIQLRHTGIKKGSQSGRTRLLFKTLSGGVEPPALRLTAARSDQLSYKSIVFRVFSPIFSHYIIQYSTMITFRPAINQKQKNNTRRNNSLPPEHSSLFSFLFCCCY